MTGRHWRGFLLAWVENANPKVFTRSLDGSSGKGFFLLKRASTPDTKGRPRWRRPFLLRGILRLVEITHVISSIFEGFPPRWKSCRFLESFEHPHPAQ